MSDSGKYDAAAIGELLRQGTNIMRWIRENEGSGVNSPTAITYSYDAQAGSYTAALADPKLAALKREIGRRLAPLFDRIAPASLLDAGVGEATSLAPILSGMRKPPPHVLGFDISLSRLLYAQEHLRNEGFAKAALFTAKLERIPLADNSADLVFTLHAVEPNHGREREILAELLRVTRSALVMVEPSYELGGAETRARIERLGYVRDLPGHIRALGFEPRSVERWGLDSNPANEAALIIVEKSADGPGGRPAFVSPVSGKPLVRHEDCWYCPDDGHAFPVVAGVPCLMQENALLVSKLHEFVRPSQPGASDE